MSGAPIGTVGEAAIDESPLPKEGIAYDLFRFFLALVRGGRGLSVKYITPGTNSDVAVAQVQNHVYPALTIVNHGSANIRWGYQSANQLLEPGASYTMRWKNPVLNTLVINDLGTSGIEVGISS